MGRKRKGQPVNGWLVVDKPRGLTSVQTLGRIRRLYNPHKIGHGGTLDPLATGVLPVAMGEATKTVSYIMAGKKRYTFTLRWGEATATDDAEGPVIERSDRRPATAELTAVLPRFTGLVSQVPPLFSAIKVAGARAYDKARAREDFALPARPVDIRHLTLVENGREGATFEVDCGKGAYMRALARDLGRALGTCAHVVALRRTAVGPFTEAHAISLASLEALGHSAAAFGPLLPLEAALDDIPALALSESEANSLRRGQAVPMTARSNRPRIEAFDNGSIVYATHGGKPVALARYEAGDIRPVRVLNP